MHLFQTAEMLVAGFHGIDSCGVNVAVPQQVGELYDIFLDSIKCAGKQMAQVVRKDLAGSHPGFDAQGFHVAPDVAPVQGLSIFADKHRAGLDAGLFYIIF